MSYKDKFEFDKTEGGYALVNFLADPDSVAAVRELEIPSRFNGEPVVMIGACALKSAYSLERVHIPDTVTVIGEEAFYMLFKLETVSIPGSVQRIERCAFFDCRGLRSIFFSEGLKTIGEMAFSDCANLLHSIILPKSLESIGDSASDGCWALENVTFLNPRTSFGKDVFGHCPNLPPETRLMGLVRSCDITRPIDPYVFETFSHKMFRAITLKLAPLMQEDIFSLAAKNNCFRDTSRENRLLLLEAIVEEDLIDLLEIAEKSGSGLLADEEISEKLIAHSSEHKKTEITAWLLEYKKRTFGFSPGDRYIL